MAATETRPAPASDWERYEEIFAEVEAPFAFVDLDAMWANAADLLRRARPKPVRVASKSVRCRTLLGQILARDERFRGLMTFTLPETLWLHEHDFDDLLVAYPSVDRAALAQLARLEDPGRPIVMVSSTDHLDLIEPAVAPVRVCIELDLSWWVARGRVKVGARRSPIRTPEQAVALAREVTRRPGFELAGVMGYEAHIAGVGDRPPGKPLMRQAIRVIKRLSVPELAERRAAVVRAVREVAPIELVNGGGTGSLETTAAEESVTEVTAGSGFYAPTLFDRYAGFSLRPAAAFAMPVVQRPGRGVATALGGGYPASGPAGGERLPEPWLPRGLRLDPLEGAGEVQTPVLGRVAESLRVGDRVYFRHAKAGELCERFATLHLVQGSRIVDEVPTYRGEGRCFL
jgi:D-serine deaminase-like pyridoxal phosphate-dependent protein